MEQGEQKDNNVTRFKIKFIFLEYRRIIRFLLSLKLCYNMG